MRRTLRAAEWRERGRTSNTLGSGFSLAVLVAGVSMPIVGGGFFLFVTAGEQRQGRDIRADGEQEGEGLLHVQIRFYVG